MSGSACSEFMEHSVSVCLAHLRVNVETGIPGGAMKRGVRSQHNSLKLGCNCFRIQGPNVFKKTLNLPEGSVIIYIKSNLI